MALNLGLSPTAITNLVWILLIFVTLAVILTVKFLYRRNWPFEVLIHADLNGSGTNPIIDKDRARFIKIGKNGERIYWLKKNKCPRVAHGKYTGIKKISFTIVNDSWFNVFYGKIEQKLKQLNLEPLDRNIRLAEQSITELMQNQYKGNKLSKIEMFMVGGMILALIISGFILYKNMEINKEVSANNAVAQEKQLELSILQNQMLINFTDSMKNAIATLHSVRGGSGLI